MKPRLVIELGVEERPTIRQEVASESEERRLEHWVKSRPRLLQLVTDALHLSMASDDEIRPTETPAPAEGGLTDPAVPYVEIRLYLEGPVSGWIRHCGGDESVAERVLEWAEQDEDRAAIVDAYRRLRERQAA